MLTIPDHLKIGVQWKRNLWFLNNKKNQKKNYRENSLVIEKPFQKSDPLEINNLLIHAASVEMLERALHTPSWKGAFKCLCLTWGASKKSSTKAMIDFPSGCWLKSLLNNCNGKDINAEWWREFSKNQLLSELCWWTQFGHVKHLLSTVTSGAVKCLCGHSVQSQRNFSGLANFQLNQGIRELRRWEELRNCLVSVPQTLHPLVAIPLMPKQTLSVFQINAFFGVCFQGSGATPSHYRLAYIF